MTFKMPKGKRTVRNTVRGSAVGYIGRKFWVNLGAVDEPHTQTLIAEFLNAQEI